MRGRGRVGGGIIASRPGSEISVDDGHPLGSAMMRERSGPERFHGAEPKACILRSERETGGTTAESNSYHPSSDCKCVQMAHSVRFLPRGYRDQPTEGLDSNWEHGYYRAAIATSPTGV